MPSADKQSECSVAPRLTTSLAGRRLVRTARCNGNAAVRPLPYAESLDSRDLAQRHVNDSSLIRVEGLRLARPPVTLHRGRQIARLLLQPPVSTLAESFAL